MRMPVIALAIFAVGYGLFHFVQPPSGTGQPAPAIPVFGGVEKSPARPASKTGENPDARTYRRGVRNNYERLVRNCSKANLREFGHAVGWMYIDAHGAKKRALKNPALVYYWSDTDDRVQNLVMELVSHRILTKQHFSQTELSRSGGMIPLDWTSKYQKKFPSWRKPPRTLGCPRS